MKRIEFLKRLGLGFGAAIVAPSVAFKQTPVNESSGKNLKVPRCTVIDYNGDVIYDSKEVVFPDGSKGYNKELVRSYGADSLSGIYQKIAL